MKALLALVALLALHGSLSSARTLPQASPEPDVEFDPADMSNPQDWKRRFYDVVVVINKAADVQNVRVYLKGELVKTARVSTGRENAALANPDDPSAPKHDYFTQTYTGFYTPDRIDIDHHSNTWAERSADGEFEGAFMPWAVFFNGGIATHRSPFEDLSAGRIDKRIGRRASGGCVRLHEQDAKDIFWMVRTSGGPYTDKEMASEHAPGEPDFASESAYEEKYNQLLPYSQAPMVADVDPSTGAFIDAKTKALLPDHQGNARWHYGARSLYIVINVPKNGGKTVPTGDAVQPNLQAAPLPPADDSATPVVKAPVRMTPRSQPRYTPGPAQDPISRFFNSIFKP